MSYSDLKIKRKAQNGLMKICSVAFLIGFFIFILILTVSSFIILSIPAEYKHLHIFVMIATALSALFCAVFSCVSVGKNRLITGMSVTMMLSITEFIVLLCFNNISLSYNIYFLFPIAIFFGFVGSVIGINVKKK